MFYSLDWIVLAAYILLSTGAGLWLSRGNKDYASFMFGGSKVPWLAVGISLIATSVSTNTFLGGPGAVFGGDMSLLMLQFGGFLSIAVVWKVFVPRLRTAGISSAYELLEQKFDRSVRILAASLYTLTLVLRTGVLVFGTSKALSLALGVSMSQAIVITALMAAVYTWFGGIRAVIWTDVIQFAVLMGGGIWALSVLIFDAGGIGAFIQEASAAGKTNWFTWGWNPVEANHIVSMGVAYAVMEIALRGCDQQFVQRYLSCKDVAAANRSSLGSAFFGLIAALVFFFVGAGLFLHYQGAFPEGVEDLDKVFLYFIMHEMPAGLRGLLIGGVVAAAMSSMDSALTALSNTTVNDFLGKKKDDPQALPLARKSIALWTIVATSVALWAASSADSGVTSVLVMALKYLSLFLGPLLGLFLFAFYRSKTSPKALWVGVLSWVCILVPQMLGVYALKDYFSWPWSPLVGLGLMSIVTLIVDFVIQRNPHERTK